jgi:tetratricopeptide (TPR) repeat protein
MNTLFRIINAVFTGYEFQSVHEKIGFDQIYEQLEGIPYQLSIEQKKAVLNALTNDVSYIQGPPGTGKSFTISALSLVASSLGQKVLVTSQKLPAVEIVYSKITKVLGDESCLFLSEDTARKQQTKQAIANILERSRTLEYDADKGVLIASVNSTLERLERAKEQLGEIYKLLNEHYRNNEAYLEALDRVQKIYPDALVDFESIKTQFNDEADSTLKSVLQTCRNIRTNANLNGGQVDLSEALKLKINVLSIMRRMGASIEDYRKYREDYLGEMITLAEDKSAAWRVKEKIDPEQVRYLRNTQIVALEKLYEWDSNGENLLAKKLSSDNCNRMSKLMTLKGYSESLRAFTARLRWKTKSRVESANKKIDFTRLFEVFPIVLGEIKALHPYLPFQSEVFDLVIIDEASQVNLAEIVPILYRAKRICIVGDHKQLGIEAGGLMFMNKFFERLMWQRHFENMSEKVLTVDEAKQRNLLVTDSSILDLARNEANALLTETNSNLLREHFRSLPMLAEFTSNEFYRDNPKEEGLRVMTSTPGRQKLIAFKNIEVEGTRLSESNKSNPDEVSKVIVLISGILGRQSTADLEELWEIQEINGIPSVGVVSFISDQITALEEGCLKTFSIEDWRKIDLMIGTPEKFQGNERDVIIFSPSVDGTCSRSVGFMEEPSRFNVATSRAKLFTFFVHGKIPNNMERMQRLIKTMESPKTQSENKVKLPRGWSADPVGIRSQIEKELYEDLQIYRSARNAAGLHVFNKVKTCGLVADFVVYSERDDRAMLIEIDGKNSVVLPNEDNDRQTERLLTFRRAGWDVYYYDYLKRYKSGRETAFSELIEHADKFFALT